MELRHGPYTYGWLQSRTFDNGRKPDRATPRAGRSSSERKPLFCEKKSWSCEEIFKMLNREYQRYLYIVRGVNQKTGERVTKEFEATSDEVPGRFIRIKNDNPKYIFNSPYPIRKIRGK
ncbi:hypothetical protein HYW53_00295 [Candidatus Giovannonibacteria bacterium]|nr:hypothetical protein [Candidatus Giovannonibacteria bacterium]